MGKFDEMKRLLYESYHNENYHEYAIPLWNAEIEEFTKNLDDTLEFIKTEATDENLFFLSEIFDDICSITHDKRFLDTIRERAKTIDPTLEIYSQNVKKGIIEEADYAEDWLDSDTNSKTF